MKAFFMPVIILLFSLTFPPAFTHAESISSDVKTTPSSYSKGSNTSVNEARDLSFLVPMETLPEEIVEVNYINYWVRQDLNIRSLPSKDGEKIGVIPTGEKVSIAQQKETTKDSWLPIKWGDIEGFVAKKYLSEYEYLPVPEKDNVEPSRIYVMGKMFTYQNGGKEFGQSVIDNNVDMVSTWGGASTWSGTDEMNTHFIAHSSGAFKGLWDINPGEVILVSDEGMNSTKYVVIEKFLVDDYGVKDAQNFFDYIAGKEGGEVITLQTCETEDTNWIIRAEKIE